MSSEHADILIVCGQGVYKNGEYAAEYDDRDVYLDHALAVRDIVRRYQYSHVVCSGGFTQPGMREVSEAQSFLSMWRDAGAEPEQASILCDEYSLDSAENVYLGMMVARQGLGDIPIRRVGVFAAWEFKKRRFNLVARELGIVRRFYFHGFASASRANASEMALKGENDFVERITKENDALLLSSSAIRADEIRKRRFCGAPAEHRYNERYLAYPARLTPLRSAFPTVFATLDDLQSGRTDEKIEALRAEFQYCVVHGASALHKRVASVA